MPSPLSEDLRQRIVDAYLNDEGSSRALAARFKVAPSTVSVLCKNLEQRGTLAPLPNRGRTSFWQEPQQAILRQMVEAKPDATLQQLADALAQPLKRTFDTSAISRALSRIGVTRKKKISTPRSETPPRSKPSERPTASGSRKSTSKT
jgi:transposase